jgi:hypothetical protein
VSGRKELKLCIDVARTIALLEAVCECIHRFVAVFAVPPCCTALTSIALPSALDWTTQ